VQQLQFPFESTATRAWHGTQAASIQNGADRRLVCPGKFSLAIWVGDAELADKRMASLAQRWRLS
jgi:hypothetical protein